MTDGVDPATQGPEQAMAHTSDGKAVGSSPKSILLFSDGTGNSSAKLFKTNVWRMYEAVDLGPPAEGKRAQISYYDDGVGTSSFKPLTVLGGAFGWGLQRNIMDIYRYACRNYRDGDDIYAFGFSRGAFTARLAVALIASQGLVRSTDEAELDRKSREAYRAFRAEFLPRRLKWPTRLMRRISSEIRRRLARLKKHEPYNASENLRPKVRFIGVWDTVSAYGGPIIEITRAIDNWIYPLSMPDYQLHTNVLCARHALAIDDERDAFHPLVWDEVHEEALHRQDPQHDKNRVQQVWFTGMHADVGGGYPDESLSYVSLLWMMEEAEKAGLRTLTVIKDRIVALASSYGPMHDSRAGVGAYYRYQPRKIAAWLNPVDPTTRILRDPVITDDNGRPRGLLTRVKVHESVINRIATGTDRYAPITLPERFEIVPPQLEGENAPQSDNQTPAPRKTAIATPMVTGETRARVTDAAVSAARARATEPIWNIVWWRRLTYFATLTATLLLLALPLYTKQLLTPPILADGRTPVGGIIRLLTFVLPTSAGKWVEVYANNPFYFILLGGITFAFMSIGTRLERRLRDRARSVWQRTTEGDRLPEPPASLTQSFRNSPRYQGVIQWFKWYWLPNWIVAPFIVLFATWVVLAGYTQIRLAFLEVDLCTPSSSKPILAEARDFETSSLCSESFGRVAEGQRYSVTFDVTDGWSDASLPTNPEGLAMGDLPGPIGYLAGPFRRVIAARYLQPILEVRPDEKRRNIQMFPLEVRTVGDSKNLYRAEFSAQQDGELFMFSNDAMLPLGRVVGYDYFYKRSGDREKGPTGNIGKACVTVEHLGHGSEPVEPERLGSICHGVVDRK